MAMSICFPAFALPAREKHGRDIRILFVHQPIEDKRWTRMKQYVVDTLRLQEYERLKKILEARHGAAALGGIYWIPVPESLYTPDQSLHTGCTPHVVALDLSETRLSCEFLIRTRKTMHCACMGYATEAQRNWIVDMVDALLEEAGVVA
jgi:hypothetical protein